MARIPGKIQGGYSGAPILCLHSTLPTPEPLLSQATLYIQMCAICHQLSKEKVTVLLTFSRLNNNDATFSRASARWYENCDATAYGSSGVVKV